MLKTIFLFTVLCLMSTSVFAAGEIAFIDLQKALNLSDAGVKAKAEIGQQVKKYEAQVAAEQQALKDMQKEMEKQAVLLSDDARAKKEREFQQRAKEFQRFTKDIQEELQQKDADFTRKIIDEILKTARQYGKDKGYGLILEKAESSIIYGDPALDLTDEVIKAFNTSSK